MAPGDWSRLPLDLLGDIAIKLEAIEDFIYFSAVCHSWNRASSLMKRQWKPILPWLLLAENTSNNPHGVRKIFNPSNNKSYKLNIPVGAKCWGSEYGWVAMVDRNLDVRLFNPITKAELRFPSAETLPDRQPYDDEVNEDGEDYIGWFLRIYLWKLVVLKVSQNEFVILVIYGDNFDHLAFAKQGDKSWTSVFVKEGNGRRMFDVVAMNGYVFVLHSNASLAYWNIEDFQGHELVKPMEYLSSELVMFDFIHGLGTLYLVESGCDLLMVLRFKKYLIDSNGKDDLPDVYETVGFSVYRLDSKDRRWEEIKDHTTLFIGGNSTMSVSAKSVPPNYIYFTDDEFEASRSRSELGRPDMGVYDMKCEKKWRFYEGEDIDSAYCTPTWFIPQL